MKKGLRWIASMRFAVMILIAIGLGSVIGSLIPQHASPDAYTAQYGETASRIILQLGFDRVFTTWWYIAMIGLMCTSLLFCVVFRVKPLQQMIRRHGWSGATQKLGSWLLHIGILCTILFFAIGNATAYDSTLYNVPGTTTPVEGIPYAVQIDDFQVILRDDGSVESYITTAKIQNDQGEVLKEADIEVNHPMNVDGYQYSQTAMGYAVDATILRNGESIGTAVLFNKEYVTADSEKLIIEMVDLFPDYVMTAQGPGTASSAMRNPYVLYRAYYMGSAIGMEARPMDRPITIEEYNIIFSNPRMYTLLSVRKDAFAKATAGSAALLVAGILMVFYGNPNEKKTPDTAERKEETV